MSTGVKILLPVASAALRRLDSSFTCADLFGFFYFQHTVFRLLKRNKRDYKGGICKDSLGEISMTLSLAGFSL